jgi:hypothetical protein
VIDAQEKLRLEQRFWSKVERGRQNECWPWKKGRHPDGYGSFRWTNPVTGKNEVTHASRVAFYLTYGYLPTMACHRCDNPPCCNPSCIYDGDAATNGADKAERGRARGRSDQRGEKNSYAVLTEEIVREARRLYADGLSCPVIGKRYGISGAVIGYAVRGDTWAHITDPPPVTERRRQGGKLTATQVEEMKKLRAENVPLKIIAEQYGVSVSNVSYMTKDRTKSIKRPKRKLTDEEVRSIREMRARNVPLKDVSIQHNVSVSMVSHIMNGRAYQHVK